MAAADDSESTGSGSATTSKAEARVSAKPAPARSDAADGAGDGNSTSDESGDDSSSPLTRTRGRDGVDSQQEPRETVADLDAPADVEEDVEEVVPDPSPAPPAAAPMADAPRHRYDAAAQNATHNEIVYTDEPTLFDQVVVGSLYVMRAVSGVLGIDLYGVIGKILENDDPPWFVRAGLDVRRTEYPSSGEKPWDVWEFRPPNPTGKTVIAVHGGGFIVEPLVTHWLDYAQMARQTGATVLVPMYPLATTPAGTAVTAVPVMAQFIADQIAARGAHNVSIYADSAGPSLAMAAVRELIQTGRPVPASMVLLSFAPDASLSNPAIYDVRDPIIDVRNLDFYTRENHWGDGLDPQDPLLSPLFFEDAVLAALPPTTIYVGELEYALPDTLLLHEKWSAAGGVVSTVVGVGQFHDWALGGLPVNSQAPKVRPAIYRQLGLNDVAPGPNTITTGPPTYSDRLVADILRTLRWLNETTGITILSGLAGASIITDPPPLLMYGLTVTEREFNGWTVWEIAAPRPSGEYVVALHGGGFESEANILHWSDYAQMARDTAATVLVPIYPLAPPKNTGTAATLVPPMADYVSQMIAEHGVDNVSLYGDSSGGSYAVLVVRELLRRCAIEVACVPSQAGPSRMVLISPALHLTLRGHGVDAIDDPILPRHAPGEGPRFNGDWSLDDPRVNPIAGDDLSGLPPTTVYIGTQEKLYPGAIAFRDKVLAQDPTADLTVVIGDGQLHGWALGGIVVNSQAQMWRPNVYRQLGLLPTNSARYVTLAVA